MGSAMLQGHGGPPPADDPRAQPEGGCLHLPGFGQPLRAAVRAGVLRDEVLGWNLPFVLPL